MGNGEVDRHLQSHLSSGSASINVCIMDSEVGTRDSCKSCSPAEYP